MKTRRHRLSGLFDEDWHGHGGQDMNEQLRLAAGLLKGKVDKVA